MHRSGVVAAAAALVMAAQPALASGSASASASFTGLTVTLFDLNPLDSITPSLTFSSYGYYDNYGSVSVYEFDGTNYASDYGDFGMSSTGPWQPGSASASTALASASASLTGPGTLTGSSLAAAGTATAPGAISCTSPYAYSSCNTPNAQFSTQVTAPYYYYYGTQFTVSANTLVLVTGTASITAQASGGGVQQTFDYLGDPYTWYYGNYAYANTYIVVNGPSASGSGSGSQSSSDQLNLNASTYWDGQGWVESTYGTVGSSNIAVTFVNASGADMSGYMQTYAYAYGVAYGDTVAVPVPEPGSYALMLAGLLGLGARLRRRRAA